MFSEREAALLVLVRTLDQVLVAVLRDVVLEELALAEVLESNPRLCQSKLEVERAYFFKCRARACQTIP